MVVVVPVHHTVVVVVIVKLLQVQAATPSAAPNAERRSGSVPSEESSGNPKYSAHASLCCPPIAAALALRLSFLSSTPGSVIIFPNGNRRRGHPCLLSMRRPGASIVHATVADLP